MKDLSKIFKSLYPHLIALAIFITLGSIYLYPQLNGNDLKQSDYSQYLGMSKEISDFREATGDEALWTNSMFSGMPAYQISTKPNTNLVAKIRTTLIFKVLNTPLSYIFLSMLGFYILLLCFNVSPWLSIIGAIAFGFSSINILYLGAGHITKVHSIALLPPIIGAIFYTYRKNFITGGVLTSLFTCLHLSANHLQETYYLLFLIVAIVVVELVRYVINKEMLKFIKISAFLLLFGIIGTLPTSTNLLTTSEYGKYTTRGESELTVSSNNMNDDKTSGLDSDYIKQYSMGFGEVWSIVIPNVKGGVSSRLEYTTDKINEVDMKVRENISQASSYWGEQLFTGGAFYFGAIMFLLAFLGLMCVRDPIKWALLAASLLAVVLSWKYGAILDFFINNVPMFSKFRDTKMMLVLVQLSIPLLGILFLKELVKKELNKKVLAYSIGGVLLVFFIIYLSPDTWFSFYSNMELSQFAEQLKTYANNPQALDYFELYKSELKDLRITIFRADLMRSILYMLFAGALIYLYVITKLKKVFLIAGLGLMILIDIWVVDKRYLNNEQNNGEYISWQKKYEKLNPYKATVADNEILKYELSINIGLQEKIEKASKSIKRKDVERKYRANEKEKIAFRELNFATNYRVYNLQSPFASTSTSYYHKSIGGYHGAKLKKYQELIDFRIDKETKKIISFLQGELDSTITYNEFFKNELPTLNMLNTKYIIYNPNAKPLINSFANGNAWFVKEVKIVETADDEILSLNDINPKVTAVVNSKYDDIISKETSYNANGNISLLTYKPNYLEYKTNSNSNQIALFSEIYYKDGWNAYIDGELVNHFCANYVLRGLTIPSGKHKIEFKFEPKTFYTGKTISLIGSIILLLMILGVVYMEVKKKKQLNS